MHSCCSKFVGDKVSSQSTEGTFTETGTNWESHQLTKTSEHKIVSNLNLKGTLSPIFNIALKSQKTHVFQWKL